MVLHKIPGITNQTLGVRKGNIAGDATIALIVGNDLDLAIVENTDARVGCAQINADGKRIYLLKLGNKVRE